MRAGTGKKAKELLPCPFCGGDALWHCYPTLATVECSKCECRLYGPGPESNPKPKDWMDLWRRWNAGRGMNMEGAL